MVSFRPEAGLLIPISGLEKVSILLEMAELQGVMAAAVANSSIRAAVYKGRAQLILLA